MEADNTTSVNTTPSTATSNKQIRKIQIPNEQFKPTSYASKQDLAPLDNTSDAIHEMIKYLPNNNDWSKQFDALSLVRRFIKNHEDAYAMLHQNLPTIMPEVLKLVESFRSSLSKNAMITLSEICEALKEAMDPFLEAIFIKLFKKASDANNFIVEEVRKCMTSLCNYCTESIIVSIIVINSQSKAIPVKLKISLCVDKILAKRGYDVECLRQNPTLVGIMSAMISDGAAGVRNMMKDTFEHICRKNDKNVLDQIFKAGSSKDSYEKFKKILEKQGKSNGI